MSINPEQGIIKLFFSNRAASRLIRTLIISVVIVQIGLSWLLIYGQHSGIMTNINSVALLSGISSIVYIIIIFWAGTILYNYDKSKYIAAKQQEKIIKQLEHSEEKFRNLVEYAPYGIILVNKNGRIELVNEHTEKLFGYSYDELKGKSVEILIPEDKRHKHIEHRAHYIERPVIRHMGGAQNVDLKGRKKDGSEFWVDITLSSIDTGAQEGMLTIATISDISERKKAEIERKNYTTELEARNKEMEQFTYITSHDLQEPLRSISGFVNLLREEYSGKLDKDADIYIDFIAESTNRMSTLIHDLLKYIRIGAKKEFVDVDCNKIVKAVKEDLTYKINNAGATIHCSNLPVIKGLETELRLLFQNLISNAIKYRKKDITPVISIDGKERDEDWYFTVTDNGIGIDEKNKDKIFVIFQRLHLQSEYQGTGIGLAECKKIIDIHKGIIGVESKPGIGSTFYFTVSKHNNG